MTEVEPLLDLRQLGLPTVRRLRCGRLRNRHSFGNGDILRMVAFRKEQLCSIQLKPRELAPIVTRTKKRSRLVEKIARRSRLPAMAIQGAKARSTLQVESLRHLSGPPNLWGSGFYSS